jgi:nitroreductase
VDLKEAIKTRHSVRQYDDKKIEEEIEKDLRLEIASCNEESGLNIHLCLNEEKAFNSGILAKLTSLKNVKNYIVIVGKKSEDLDEKIGYYGEKIVLKATQLGINSCWVASGYKKSKLCVKKSGDEKLFVIAIGYGVDNGKVRKTKPIDKLGNVTDDSPQWFRDGLKFAQLAPTARNQQKFKFILSENLVEAKTSSGFFTKIDLGIAKYHFEVGADFNDWDWKA